MIGTATFQLGTFTKENFMRRHFVAVIALLALAPPASAQTQPSQQSIINGVQALGATWKRIVDNQETFVIQCPAGGFAAYRLAKNTTVAVDLRKTDSLLNPYIGSVNLSGVFQTNKDRQEGACLSSMQAALTSQDFWGNPLTFDFALTYQVVDGKLQWTSADPVFMTNGGNAMTYMTKGTHPDWGRVLVMPLQ
jgi:hypothetical protein